MAALVPATSKEAGSLTKVQQANFYKGAADLTMRQRLLGAMMKKYGMIEYNADSHSYVWTAETSQPTVQQYEDMGRISFDDHDPFIQFSTDVRGYIATDQLSLKKQLMNRGAGQTVNLKQTKPVRLVKALMNQLCKEYYCDGNAAGSTNRFHGINSFLGDDGNTIAADRVANPSDSYAGQTTAIGNGGTWGTSSAIATKPNATIGTDWPFPSGDMTSEYDATTPLLVNISSTSWGTGSTEWRDNCEPAMRFARITQNVRGARGEDGRTPFLQMLSADLFTDFLEHWAPKTRLLANHGESERLGFGDALNFEGDVVHYEFDTPAGEGYGISPSMMELFLLGPQMYTQADEFELRTLATNFAIYTFGNFRYQTRFFTKYKKYA